jgi:hypothetical protein
VQAALVASVSEESGLPKAEDYLFDEQALDNFLQGRNIESNKRNIN